MPHGFDISDKARDLTLRLLQREPLQRITFEEFFAHPFIDMEHIPSQNSLPNAVSASLSFISENGKLSVLLPGYRYKS